MKATLARSLREPARDRLWEGLAKTRVFWIGTAGTFIAAILLGRSLDDLPDFLLIAVTASLPAFLWCRRAVHGIPIYPIFALGTLWTFGFPLISQQPAVMAYGANERLAAALTVAMTNLVGCAGWFIFTQRISRAPFVYLGFRGGHGDRLFSGALVADIIFNLTTSSVDLHLDPAIFSLVRAIVQATGSLAIFVLGYRSGQRQITALQSRVYVVMIVTLIVSNLPSVLMVNALSDGGLALMAFALGAGRLPYLALLLFVGSATFLQEGKSSIREKYWSDAEGAPISFSHFPEFMEDWIGFSWNGLIGDHDSVRPPGPSANAEPQSLVERASLLQLFLLIQKMSPSGTPYLHGASYAIVPRLLVPRTFNEEKERTHLGTYLLTIHYDLQKPEDTSMTTIGFGLINEALANFGYAGCAGLGALLGGFYGWVARWSSAHPLLSFRALFAILVLTVAFETEFTAGVYITVLFQGTCALLFLAVLTMRRLPFAMKRMRPASPFPSAAWPPPYLARS